jgi:hypothetical protein
MNAAAMGVFQRDMSLRLDVGGRGLFSPAIARTAILARSAPSTEQGLEKVAKAAP